MLHEQMVV